MKLIISFSGRTNGNCDNISDFLAEQGDNQVYFRDLNVHACCDCSYECFHGDCKYRHDDSYRLYKSMLSYDKIVLIVPMYCGNPSSLYFKFNERCQDFFIHNETCYEEIISRLYIIGVYGSEEETPDFIPCLEKWFDCSTYTHHVLGIQRHKYDQKINDQVLEIEELRDRLRKFIYG